MGRKGVKTFRPTLEMAKKKDSPIFNKDIVNAVRSGDISRIEEVRRKYHAKGYCINLNGLCEPGERCYCHDKDVMKQHGY